MKVNTKRTNTIIGKPRIPKSIIILIFSMVAIYAYSQIPQLPYEEKAPLLKFGSSKTGYGFIDCYGNIIVPSQYDDIGIFQNGMCSVKKGRHWGFVDSNGTEIISTRYDSCGIFKEGFAKVIINDSCFFIRKDGSLLKTERHYDEIFDFNEGLACVTIGITKDKRAFKKMGFINNKGEEVIPCTYGYSQRKTSYEFNDGMVVLRKKHSNYKIEQFIFVNQKNQILNIPSGTTIPSQSKFSEGVAWLQDKKFRGILINKKGEVIGKTSCNGFFTPFKNGYSFCNQEEWTDHGYILVIDRKCNDVLKYYEKKDSISFIKKDDEAVFQLGCYYYEKKIYTNAYKIFSHLQNHSRAQYFMGWMNQYGQGVIKDLDRAVRCYNKSNEVQAYNQIKNIQESKVRASNPESTIYYIEPTKNITQEQNHDSSIERTANTKPQRCIALVLGISDYQYLRDLNSPTKDAEDIGTCLKKLGFNDVRIGRNLKASEMKEAINKFTTDAKEYDVALFYYSGHGIQKENENYLLPSDFTGEKESDLFYCDRPRGIMEDLDQAGCKLKIIVIDACREPPYNMSKGSKVIGLAPMEGTAGTFIIYATAENKTASDGKIGENSRFTNALLHALEKPGLNLHEVFDHVGEEVRKESKGTQTPKINYQPPIGRFIFNNK